MATIVNGIVGTYESDVYDPSPFFDALEDAFDFVSVSGTNANKVFKLSDKISIKFTNFDKSTSNESPKISVIVNSNEIEIVSWTYNYFSPSSMAFRLTKGVSGDLIVQIETGTHNDRLIHNSSDFAFAIVAVENAVSKESAGYGIYVPWYQGGNYTSVVSKMDPTPKYLLTDDTTDDMSNTGYAGDTTYALRYICKEGLSKITALVPIAAVCSECVSVNSWIMMLTDNYRNGYAQMNGEKYYCVGGFCMYEGAADNA